MDDGSCAHSNLPKSPYQNQGKRGPDSHSLDTTVAHTLTKTLEFCTGMDHKREPDTCTHELEIKKKRICWESLGLID